MSLKRMILNNLVLFLFAMPAFADQILLHIGSPGGGSCTAFIVQTDLGNKYIMTNKHCCDLGPMYLMSQQGKYPPIPIFGLKKSHENDLCLLALPKGMDVLPACKLAAEEPVSMQPVQSGGISSKGMSQQKGYYIGGADNIKTHDNTNTVYIVMKTVPGNSGSPVFDTHENLVAVRWGYAKNDIAPITLAVRLNDIRKFLLGL